MYQWGFIGAILHMAEILPLVALLLGLFTLPAIPICAGIAITQPLTCGPYAFKGFWFRFCCWASSRCRPSSSALASPSRSRSRAGTIILRV